jgi:hypothetical protein
MDGAEKHLSISQCQTTVLYSVTVLSAWSGSFPEQTWLKSADLSNWAAELSGCQFVLVPKCPTQVLICPSAEVSRIPHTHIRSRFNWYFYSNKWPPHQHGQQSHKVYPIVSIDQYLRVHVQMLYESKCVVLVQGGKSGPNWKSCSHCFSLKKLWSIQQYSNLWKKIEVEMRNVIERWHSTMCMYQLKCLDTRCY